MIELYVSTDCDEAAHLVGEFPDFKFSSLISFKDLDSIAGEAMSKKIGTNGERIDFNPMARLSFTDSVPIEEIASYFAGKGLKVATEINGIITPYNPTKLFGNTFTHRPYSTD